MPPYHEKRVNAVDLISSLPADADIIIPLGNGEPDTFLKAIEDFSDQIQQLRVHQLLEIKDRKYIQGIYPQIRYKSYFLGPYARKSYLNGMCDLIPNHFHQMPRLLQTTTKFPVIVAQCSQIDKDGYFSLGTQADYVASFIGKAPFYLEVNTQMPRVYGDHQIHINQIQGFLEVDKPLYKLHTSTVLDVDRKIGEYVAERIENGSTLQVGIGGIPDAVLQSLTHHKNLGVHTEMFTDSLILLYKHGAITNSQKHTFPGKMVATFALGSQELYDFLGENESVYMLPVDQTNDPRLIALEDRIVSINATTEVDFYGQCASETISGKYYSSSGGQVDFVTGARFAKEGKSFLCLHSTTKDGRISRIRSILTPGSVVTTSKNDVDFIVTEYGVAELRGKTIAQRTASLISIAHPNFREQLLFEAKALGFIF